MSTVTIEAFGLAHACGRRAAASRRARRAAAGCSVSPCSSRSTIAFCSSRSRRSALSWPALASLASFRKSASIASFTASAVVSGDDGDRLHRAALGDPLQQLVLFASSSSPSSRAGDTSACTIAGSSMLPPVATSRTARTSWSPSPTRSFSRYA